MEFLNSPDARLIRMLSEYLEPRRRFKQQKVKDTIVFFGSSKILSREEAEKRLNTIKDQYNSNPSKENTKKFKIAQKQVEMSQYYEDARTLSRLITKWSMRFNRSNSR